jgi:hypothetical protein
MLVWVYGNFWLWMCVTYIIFVYELVFLYKLVFLYFFGIGIIDIIEYVF